MYFGVKIYVFVKLLCLTLQGAAAVFGELPSPTNVRINSFNMGLVLEWNAPQNHTENITYRAEYKPLLRDFEVVCLNTTAHSCEFTSELNPLGIYSFRVRAERERSASSWVGTKEFIMDEHTILGPPSVTLVPDGADMELNIEDPVLRIKTFRRVYNNLTFNITYWKDGQEEKAESMKSPLQKVVLNLEPLTRYCFQVYVLTGRFSKQSQPSIVTCESTKAYSWEKHPWLIALGAFAGMAVTVGVLCLIVWRCYRVARFLKPKATLPEHLTEFLLDQRRSFLAMQSRTQPEEVYHEVSILFLGTETDDGDRPLVDKTNHL
ncbi:hypothetical protein UPYG_G00158440 [Umbra pygmaea]|uniref:Fibronectin type-III domain-containing protein n=1 Tax=Umbra pygmaea TaxID=75934 RepID=A0ABD0WYQ6_UMBPY